MKKLKWKQGDRETGIAGLGVTNNIDVVCVGSRGPTGPVNGLDLGPASSIQSNLRTS